LAREHNQPRGFATPTGREAKAEKLLTVLERSGHPISEHQRVLDIGTGSGHIADRISQIGSIVACDVVDQRVAGRNLPFVQAGELLPFTSGTFDLVISNHVVEHVDQPDVHLSEIHRVLRPGGVAYLATPNRLWPWEPHTRLPLLHYLPPRVFSWIAGRLGKTSEGIQLQSLASLRRHTRGLFTLTPWHQEVLKSPRAYALDLTSPARFVLRLIPDRLIALSKHWQPTLICLLVAT